MPAAELCSRLGAGCHWDREAGTVTITYRGHTAVLTVGTEELVVDGAEEMTFGPTVERDGQVYLNWKVCDYLEIPCQSMTYRPADHAAWSEIKGDWHRPTPRHINAPPGQKLSRGRVKLSKKWRSHFFEKAAVLRAGLSAAGWANPQLVDKVFSTSWRALFRTF